MERTKKKHPGFTQIVGAFCAVVVACMVGATQVSAVPMVATYTAEIYNVHNITSYSAGDEITFTVNYDDEGTNYSFYNDGLNGIAESGEGDDTISSTFDISSRPDYLYYDDVTFGGIEEIYTTMGIPQGATAHEHESINYSFGTYAPDGTQKAQYYGDDYLLDVVYYHYQDYVQYGGGVIRREWSSDGSSWNTSTLWFEITDITLSEHNEGDDLQPVPEPSIWLLLSSGLVGLAYFRRKRQIQ